MGRFRAAAAANTAAAENIIRFSIKRAHIPDPWFLPMIDN